MHFGAVILGTAVIDFSNSRFGSKPLRNLRTYLHNTPATLWALNTMPKLLITLRWIQRRSLCPTVPIQQHQWTNSRAITSARRGRREAIQTPEAAAVEKIRERIWGVENGGTLIALYGVVSFLRLID